jgi:hypothetical protein
VDSEFYHLQFQLICTELAQNYLGEQTSQDLIKSFRNLEKVVLFVEDKTI